MRFALGMDNREIARALDRSEGATKVLIHRAIKQLEQGLKRRRPAMSEFGDVEALLRSALVPVEPSEGADRPPRARACPRSPTLAVDELADWELSTMRDPRNWGRPVAPRVVGGGAAAGALVLVRARQHRRNGRRTVCARSRRACARSAQKCAGAFADPRLRRRG